MFCSNLVSPTIHRGPGPPECSHRGGHTLLPHGKGRSYRGTRREAGQGEAGALHPGKLGDVFVVVGWSRKKKLDIGRRWNGQLLFSQCACVLGALANTHGRRRRKWGTSWSVFAWQLSPSVANSNVRVTLLKKCGISGVYSDLDGQSPTRDRRRPKSSSSILVDSSQHGMQRLRMSTERCTSRTLQASYAWAPSAAVSW